jgi:undecaprenyl pyrophosphate phosphatase UppP
MKENSLASLILIVAVITTAVFILLSLNQKEQAWLGVAAGFLAIEGLLCFFSEHFWLAKKGEYLKINNPAASRISCLIGIAAGILWILSVWPGILLY